MFFEFLKFIMASFCFLLSDIHDLHNKNKRITPLEENNK